MKLEKRLIIMMKRLMTTAHWRTEPLNATYGKELRNFTP